MSLEEQLEEAKNKKLATEIEIERIEDSIFTRDKKETRDKINSLQLKWLKEDNTYYFIYKIIDNTVFYINYWEGMDSFNSDSKHVDFFNTNMNLVSHGERDFLKSKLKHHITILESIGKNT